MTWEAISSLLVVRAPRLCPELLLKVADAPLPLWELLETHVGTRLDPPFWAHAWPGSLALSRWLLDHPDQVAGKSVLDFASGCGVSAIAAAKAGASEVIATEIDRLAIRAIEQNAAINLTPLEVRHGDVIDTDEGWPLILVGDVFYQAQLGRRVTAWLETLVARGATVLIGDPGRSFLPHERLNSVATYALDPNPEWDSVIDRPPTVWKFRSR